MPDVHLLIDGRDVRVPVGTIVAAAIVIAGIGSTRLSIRGELRAPLCGMGICYECRVTIDDQPHCVSCQILCREGMRVVTR